MLVAALPAAVPAIARVYRSTERGIVTCRYRRVLNVSAGPSAQHRDFLFVGIWVNGVLMKVRMLRYTIDGKAADASQIAGVVSAYEHPKPGDLFEAPWDSRFANDYRDAPYSHRTIAFTATNRSYGHGDGRFTYDAHNDVVTYSYTPIVLPEHATSGTVQGRRAQVLPGYWATTTENQAYGGHYAVFGAHATVQITQSNFRRYSSMSAALAALR